MRCWNCNQEMPDKAKVCGFCEAPVEDEPTEEEEEAVRALLEQMPSEVFDEFRAALEKSKTADDFADRILVRLLPFSNDLKARKSCENGQPRFLETTAPHRGVSKTQGLEPCAEVSALLNKGFPEV